MKAKTTDPTLSAASNAARAQTRTCKKCGHPEWRHYVMGRDSVRCEGFIEVFKGRS